MKILYDHQIFAQQNYGGISRYFCELMDRLSRNRAVQLTLALRYSQNENLLHRQGLYRSWSKPGGYFLNPAGSFLYRATHMDIMARLVSRLHLNEKESVRLLKKRNFDLFHPTYYNPYFLKYLGKKPYVLTVYDMIHELYPAYFSHQDPTRVWKKQLIENADVVIAISQNTKNDILRFADVDPDRISVIYLGNPFEYVQHSSPACSPAQDPVPWAKPYLLFVGTRTAYKNFDFFIQAIVPLLKKDPELQVVCAGGGPFHAGELDLIRKLNISASVHYVRTNDRILEGLYRGARAFVFPSLYEGFGLPILEAFSCGCPLVASNSSSLSEIAGNAAQYIDPTDPVSLVRGVDAVLSDGLFREALIRNGYERSKAFSWEKTARETQQVYDNLVYQ